MESRVDGLCHWRVIRSALAKLILGQWLWKEQRGAAAPSAQPVPQFSVTSLWCKGMGLSRFLAVIFFENTRQGFFFLLFLLVMNTGLPFLPLCGVSGYDCVFQRSVKVEEAFTGLWEVFFFWVGSGVSFSPVAWSLAGFCTAWMVQLCTVTVRVIIQALVWWKNMNHLSYYSKNAFYPNYKRFCPLSIPLWPL